MSGMAYMIIGLSVLLASTVAVSGLELWLKRKKREIRQRVYQIYD